MAGYCHRLAFLVDFEMIIATQRASDGGVARCHAGTSGPMCVIFFISPRGHATPRRAGFTYGVSQLAYGVGWTEKEKEEGKKREGKKRVERVVIQRERGQRRERERERENVVGITRY